MQYLDLALRAVGDVEHDRAVGRVGLVVGVFGQRHEVANARLHLRQQCVAGALVEQIDLRALEALPGRQGIVEGIELAHEIAALPAPRGEQRVGVGVHLVERNGRQIAPLAQRVAAPFHAQQLAAFDDVGPVVAAWVRHGQQYLALLRQGGQRLQGLHRHMGHAEQHDAPGHRRHRRGARIERGEKTPVQLRSGGGAFVLAQRGEQFAPQCGLPALVWRQRGGPLGPTKPTSPAEGRSQHVMPGRPRIEPVAAVDLVLIEKIGQALGELKAARHVAVAQEARQWFEARARQQPGQALHQAPGERQLVQRRLGRHRVGAQHLAVSAPQEAAGQLHARGRADAAARGQRHLEPLRHAVALDQKNLFLERLQGAAAQPLEHRLGEQFGPVAVEHQQAGSNLGGHANGTPRRAQLQAANSLS